MKNSLLPAIFMVLLLGSANIIIDANWDTLGGGKAWPGMTSFFKVTLKNTNRDDTPQVNIVITVGDDSLHLSGPLDWQNLLQDRAGYTVPFHHGAEVNTNKKTEPVKLVYNEDEVYYFGIEADEQAIPQTYKVKIAAQVKNPDGTVSMPTYKTAQKELRIQVEETIRMTFPSIDLIVAGEMKSVKIRINNQGQVVEKLTGVSTTFEVVTPECEGKILFCDFNDRYCKDSEWVYKPKRKSIDGSIEQDANIEYRMRVGDSFYCENEAACGTCHVRMNVTFTTDKTGLLLRRSYTSLIAQDGMRPINIQDFTTSTATPSHSASALSTPTMVPTVIPTPEPTPRPTLKPTPTSPPTPTTFSTPSPKELSPLGSLDSGSSCTGDTQCESSNCMNKVCCLAGKVCCTANKHCDLKETCEMKRFYCVSEGGAFEFFMQYWELAAAILGSLGIVGYYLHMLKRKTLGEEKVKVRRGVTREGNVVKIGVKVVNDSTFPLVDVGVELDVPKAFRIDGGSKFIDLGTIRQEEYQSAIFSLVPTRCVSGNVLGSVIYHDVKNKRKIIEMEPVSVGSVCPFLEKVPMDVDAFKRKVKSLPSQEKRMKVHVEPQDVFDKLENKCSAMHMVSDAYSPDGSKYMAIFTARGAYSKNFIAISFDLDMASNELVIKVYGEQEEMITGLLSEIVEIVEEAAGISL